ncbi:AI-2E family transporter [Flavobacterium caeni]|uniref:Predicted PurR-regulated permease PerM n=1 Tax=Flavobacterium caeni TaxID=490189 RepID=A0A1G5DD86_9FLAO|nr:AI-2E family transporter [Flavobacterium caeni]SCY12566.1 Predicted PurR-regulated permease PerM [Flavobacterium caeni]
MTSQTIASGIVKAVAVIAGVCLAGYLLFQIQAVLVYLIVALITTLIGLPMLNFFQRKLKFNNIFATIATVLVFVLILAGFVMMFIPLVSSQGQNLSLLQTAEIEKNLTELIGQIGVFLESHNIDSENLLKEANIGSKLNLSFIPNFLNGLLGTIGSFGVGLASVLFITFFFLKDRALFVRGARRLIPDSHEEQILNSLDKINHLLTRYFVGLALQLLIIFILYLIVLLIFGVENALVIAFLCAVLNIIPYIGPLIGSVLAALLTMISNIGGDFQTEILPTTIYVMIGFWIVQVIDNNVSSPLIFSNSVKSHPLEIFLVILAAGSLFGVIGMIAAVPMYTILKVIAKEFFPDNPVVRLLTKDI